MRLVSEQLPNDGGYHVKRLVNEANARLKQIGKQGKRATIVAKKTSLTLQFTFKDGNGRPQKNVGLGAIPLSPNGILEAEKIAQLVTSQLAANTFTWDWFNSFIGKPVSEQTKQLTCKEMVEQYKKHFYKQREKAKTPDKLWYMRCQVLEDTAKEVDKPMCLAIVRQIIETKANNTVVRRSTINGLVEFLKYFDITDYKSVIKEYKKNNNPKPKKRNVPSDNRIAEVYSKGFEPDAKCNKRYLYRFPQWQFLFSLLAVYGLRIHEAWNIANWDKPVTLKDGDWAEVGVGDDKKIELQRKAGDLAIPAILDPNNKEYILCIKHETKTGYRMTMPISPEGHNWLKEFNLLQPLNLPDIKNPLKRKGKSKSGYQATESTCKHFKRRRFNFTPHDLRHAYNHRGHQIGINPKALADSLGHSMTMNTTGYLRHMSDDVKLQGIRQAIKKEQNKRSENELLKAENEALKTQLEAANKKIELLQTKLKMYEAIEESKGSK